METLCLHKWKDKLECIIAKKNVRLKNAYGVSTVTIIELRVD